MARKVYFSFHYDRDIARVQIVRNSWHFYPANRPLGWIDRGLWEEAETKGDDAIKALIDEGLNDTGVTVVLIGTQTAHRPWVKYEIEQSIQRGKGLLGIYIHDIPAFGKVSDPRGPNPFIPYQPPAYGQTILLPYQIQTYDWQRDAGYNNLAAWVEAAARQAGR